ncbi:peptidylprolyl isomerase [Candidatus Woesearchaeota archaeon]|nr:peptidylprolyl isomerase [Candidatus Woesearchaeota archaeon]
MKVEKGNKVKVEYEGKFDDGSVFDSSKTHGKPLEFIAGQGHVVPGFDNAIVGMDKDEEKEITITPEDGYGPINAELTKEVPRDQLPKDQDPKVGMMLAVSLPNGQQVPATITNVTEEKVTIDLNHPLAGKTLHFKIKVVDITEVSEEELKKMEEAHKKMEEGGCGDGGCGSEECGSSSDEKEDGCGDGTCGSHSDDNQDDETSEESDVKETSESKTE